MKSPGSESWQSSVPLTPCPKRGGQRAALSSCRKANSRTWRSYLKRKMPRLPVPQSMEPHRQRRAVGPGEADPYPPPVSQSQPLDTDRQSERPGWQLTLWLTPLLSTYPQGQSTFSRGQKVLPANQRFRDLVIVTLQRSRSGGPPPWTERLPLRNGWVPRCLGEWPCLRARVPVGRRTAAMESLNQEWIEGWSCPKPDQAVRSGCRTPVLTRTRQCRRGILARGEGQWTTFLLARTLKRIWNLAKGRSWSSCGDLNWNPILPGNRQSASQVVKVWWAMLRLREMWANLRNRVNKITNQLGTSDREKMLNGWRWWVRTDHRRLWSHRRRLKAQADIAQGQRSALPQPSPPQKAKPSDPASSPLHPPANHHEHLLTTTTAMSKVKVRLLLILKVKAHKLLIRGNKPGERGMAWVRSRKEYHCSPMAVAIKRKWLCGQATWTATHAWVKKKRTDRWKDFESLPPLAHHLPAPGPYQRAALYESATTPRPIGTVTEMTPRTMAPLWFRWSTGKESAARCQCQALTIVTLVIGFQTRRKKVTRFSVFLCGRASAQSACTRGQCLRCRTWAWTRTLRKGRWCGAIMPGTVESPCTKRWSTRRATLCHTSSYASSWIRTCSTHRWESHSLELVLSSSSSKSKIISTFHYSFVLSGLMSISQVWYRRLGVEMCSSEERIFFSLFKRFIWNLYCASLGVEVGWGRGRNKCDDAPSQVQFKYFKLESLSAW